MNEIKMGALYRWAALFRIERSRVEQKLVDRCKMTPEKAAQLAGHWYATTPLKPEHD